VTGVFLLFSLHARWVLTHFSSDGYLYDSGWLAYLFEGKDPLLHNPRSINELSFYAHHLSPHIFLFGTPLALLGLSGFWILAVHQGLFFALFFVSAYVIAGSVPPHYRGRLPLILAAIAIGGLSNALFQAAAYPHYETAMLAVSSLALAAWIKGTRRLFLVLLLSLALIREDGGFYGAFVCLMCAVLEHGPGRQGRNHVVGLGIAAGVMTLLAASSLLIKAKFFPGFDAFALNFSGHRWNHVSRALVVNRVRAAIVNPNILPVLVGSAFLAIRDVRYTLGLALLSPLYALYMLSVRPEHGHFTLYFALPWLLPPLTWLALFVTRARAEKASATEAVLILAASLALAAPVQAAAGMKGQFWYVAEWAVTRRVVNIRSMQEFALWVLRSYVTSAPGAEPDMRPCASMGIAALIPNDLQPDEVVNASSNLAGCRFLLLLNGDMDYGVLRSHAESVRFQYDGIRYNAELWRRRSR